MAERERLTGPTTIYFDASAPDNSGDGTIGNPYQTLQHFFDNVITNIDTDIYPLTCQLAPGTYAPLDIGVGWAGQGAVRIVGDPNAPSDYIIEATAPDTDAVRTRSNMFLPSFEVQGVEIRAADGSGIFYGHAGFGYFGNIVFGDVANAMVQTDNHLQFITSSGPITIDGSAQYAQYADSGRIYWHHATTFTADVEFQAFTRVGFFGFILGDHWNHDLSGHTVEGHRFLAEGGGIISANARGLDLFPGDQPGTVTRGGQYLSDDDDGIIPAASTDDVLRGDDLDNVYTYNGGMDFFDGRGGSDTLDLSDNGTRVLIDLVAAEGEVYSGDGSIFLLYISSVENVVGTLDDDIFRGDGSDNTYVFTGGLDVFDGRNGTDTLDLSNASTPVRIDLQNPLGEVYSRDGLTFMVDTNSVEIFIGTSGDDLFLGDVQNNTYVYSGGFDGVAGRGGTDTLDLSDAGTEVWIDLEYSGGEVYSRDGVTFMVNTDSVENFIGTSGDDVFRGNAQDNVYGYNGGLDMIDGRGGGDVIDFSAVEGSVTVDLVQDAADVLYLDASIERVVITSIEHAVGTRGNDTFIGDSQRNIFVGNGGNDTFVFGTGPGSDTIIDFGGGTGASDVLDVSAFGFATATDVLARASQVGTNTVIDFGGGSTLTLLGVARSSLVADDFIIA
jgi:hypothetical protein